MSNQTKLQRELTAFYGEDAIKYLMRLKVARNLTWRQIASKVAGDTGYRVRPTTFARWASFERNGR